MNKLFFKRSVADAVLHQNGNVMYKAIVGVRPNFK